MSKLLYIDGDWVPGSAGAEDPTHDPATETLIDTVARAEHSDVDAAVGAARRALSDPSWRDLVPRDRAALLFRLADLIESDADELARLETLDQGQPLSIARNVTVPMTADHFRYYAGWVTKIQGSVNPVSTPDTFNYTRREPIGVCGLITPWNFPLSIASMTNSKGCRYGVASAERGGGCPRSALLTQTKSRRLSWTLTWTPSRRHCTCEPTIC